MGRKFVKQDQVLFCSGPAYRAEDFVLSLLQVQSVAASWKHFFFFFCPNSFNALHHHCTDDAQNWNVFQKEITFKHSDDILEQTTVPPNPVFSSKPVSDATEQRPKL